MAAGYPIIAALTQAMVDRIQQAVATSDGPVSHALVTANRPDQLAGQSGPQVNLFLYHITPSASRRNEDLPMRDSTGRLATRPIVALDLHYLISFYGTGIQSRDSLLLLGLTLGVLELQPAFNPDDLSAAWQRLNKDAPLDAALALADEPIRLTAVGLDTDEMYRLWQLFPMVPYTLSAFYRASTMMLPAGIGVPPALPVRSRGSSAAPMGAAPGVASFAAGTGGDDPLTAGGTLVITGSGLDIEGLVVEIAGTGFTPASVGPKRVEVLLTGPNVPIGAPLPLNLVAMKDGKAMASHPFALIRGIVPNLQILTASVLAGTEIKATVQPPPSNLIGTVLMLGGQEGPVLPAVAMVVIGSSANVSFSSVGVPAGTYLARIGLPTSFNPNGTVVSIPGWAGGAFNGPMVTIVTAGE